MEIWEIMDVMEVIMKMKKTTTQKPSLTSIISKSLKRGKRTITEG